jgi:hypothetical protein
MLEHLDSSSFILHTGDLVYQLGSQEYYRQNFIKPYRELLVGDWEKIAFDKMVFKIPFFPVLGNHDYYDLPFLSALVVQASFPLRSLLKFPLELNIGWEGSNEGDVYARAFLDYLKRFEHPQELINHLDQHYQGKCLLYRPENFTRLPNRYYQFRVGGIDFFALDSNTFNNPSPLPLTEEGKVYRRLLEQRRLELEQQELELLEKSHLPKEAEELDDLQTDLEQIEEIKLDIDKQLEADENTVVDFEQLNWLRERLIESWHNPQVRGRIVYFHHPPYVTESSKWNQAQTLAVRHHLRWVLNQVSEAVGNSLCERPLVDLFLSGHAHCLEYLKTENTGHADSNLNWIICGGSGFSLRRQRTEGNELWEVTSNSKPLKVANSHLFIGRSGYLTNTERPYSMLRIDVKAGVPPQFIIRPLVISRYQGKWCDRPIQSFVL